MKGVSLIRQSSLQDEVAVLLLADQRFLFALGLAPGVVVDHAVDDLPVAVVPLGDVPAGEVLAVEQGDEALRLRSSPAAASEAASRAAERATSAGAWAKSLMTRWRGGP